jgi:hypothetical protein
MFALTYLTDLTSAEEGTAPTIPQAWGLTMGATKYGVPVVTRRGIVVDVPEDFWYLVGEEVGNLSNRARFELGRDLANYERMA